MTTTDNYRHQFTTIKPIDKAQYLVCAVLVAVGAFLIYDALTLAGGFATVDPLGPRFFPIAIGIGLIVLAVLLGGYTSAWRERAPSNPSKKRNP